MTLDNQTLRLGDEYERLDATLDEFADSLATADDPAGLDQLASAAQTRLSGVAYLINEFGRDAEVVITGLTAGQFARVEDLVAEKRAHEQQDTLPGYHRNQYVTEGVVEAPFLESDADRATQLKTIADQPVGVVKWLEERINDATAVGSEDFRSLGERLAAPSED